MVILNVNNQTVCYCEEKRETFAADHNKRACYSHSRWGQGVNSMPSGRRMCHTGGCTMHPLSARPCVWYIYGDSVRYRVRVRVRMNVYDWIEWYIWFVSECWNTVCPFIVSTTKHSVHIAIVEETSHRTATDQIAIETRNTSWTGLFTSNA